MADDGISDVAVGIQSIEPLAADEIAGVVGLSGADQTVLSRRELYLTGQGDGLEPRLVSRRTR